MKIMILGANGSMGKRYQCILRALGHEPACVDLGDPLHDGCDGAIICTPTSVHDQSVRALLPYRIPILCEKPVLTHLPTLLTLLDHIRASGVPSFSMVQQYRHYGAENGYGDESSYDYFRHGNDGLVWDCFQIIALARGKVTLGETSPIWHCRINGIMLDQSKMDWAYVREIKDWLWYIERKAQPVVNLDYIEKSHRKVAAYAETYKCE